MKSRFLTDEAELNEFKTKFTKLSGNQVSMEYLQQAKVQAFFVNNTLVGGFVVNSGSNIRYLDWLPEGQGEEMLKFIGHEESDISEITCMWIDRSKVSYLQRCMIYLSCVTTPVFHTNSKIILAGTHNPKVAKTQQLGLPKVCYIGQGSEFISGKQCQMHYASRNTVFIHYSKGFFVEFYRYLKKMMPNLEIKTYP